MAIEYGSARLEKTPRYIRDAIREAERADREALVGPRAYCSRWGCGLCCLDCRRHVTQGYADKCRAKARALPTSVACVYCSRVLVTPPPREGVDG